MKKVVYIIAIVSTLISCIEKKGYYTNEENSIITLICDITWASKKTTNDEGITYQGVYQFNKNGTYKRTLITVNKEGKEQQSVITGQWSFTAPNFGTIYFGHNNYWDIDELTEKKFTVYERTGEFGEPGMIREYLEFTPLK